MSGADDYDAIDERAAEWFGGRPAAGVPPELIPLDESLERLSVLRGQMTAAVHDLQASARNLRALTGEDGSDRA
jgi:hypothetical protein